MNEVQTCPRRMQEMGPWERTQNLDTWVEADAGEGDPGPRCSFCGSLHPGRFLELVLEGWAVGPTDKPYKAYLDEVLDGPERTAVPGEPLPPVRCGRAKFYYQHLSSEQMQTFINLYRDGVMRLAYPGHFYVLPFFIRLS